MTGLLTASNFLVMAVAIRRGVENDILFLVGTRRGAKRRVWYS